MFLVPSSSRAVDPYLQTLLLRISLSRLGGKHRQLARQVGDSASSSANSMAGSSYANNVPEGTIIVFGSWAYTADASGGFPSHLVTPNSSKPKKHPATRQCLRDRSSRWKKSSTRAQFGYYRKCANSNSNSRVSRVRHKL